MPSGSARSSWLGLLVRGLAVALAGLVFGIGALVYLHASEVPEIPAVASISDQRASLVTSRDGRPIARLGPRKGEWTPLAEIDSAVVGALLATEDRRFYDHPGIDWRRSLAAAFHTLTGDLQGGSTLTQQLARNLFPRRIGTAPTLSRKTLEILTALQIEDVYTKDEILEVYLNTVPFLYGAFGIEMAARTYFGSSADALSVPQAATLVAMLKGPAYYNPVRHPERARSRRNLVLEMMVETGRLSPERFETLRSQPLNLSFRSQLLRDSPAPHFAEYVRKQLESWCRSTGCDPYRDGLRVQTSLDLRMQERARRALRRQSRILQQVVDRAWSEAELRVVSAEPTSASINDRRRPEDAFAHFWDERPALLESLIRDTEAYRSRREAGRAPEEAVRALLRNEDFVRRIKQRTTRLEAGLVALDPETGGVRVWVGSRNFEIEQYDHVVQARRQPGSTFKPFVYAAALEHGYEPETPLVDEPVTIRTASGEPWRPSNAGRATGEPIPLRQGLIHSKNTITARLLKAIGPEPVVRVAERMGVRSSPLEVVPSVGLGTSEVSLLEMTNAYASFVRQGAYRPSHAIRTIRSAEGDTLASYDPATGARTARAGAPTSASPDVFEIEQAIDSTSARSVLGMLRGVVEEGTGRDLHRRFGIGAQVGGKTGTTQGGADGWFFLVHRDLVAGSWVGFNDPRARFRTAYWGQGARTGLRVVGDFTARLIEDRMLDPEAPLPGTDRSDGPLIDLEPIAGRVGSWLQRVADRLRGPSADHESPTSDAPPDREDSPSRRGGW